ncbi:hypothetical protein OS493_039206 [Desmophyllum pertusum]|uniref:Uncharacterized protein n=1 Tax=Desmophyllum pertusum TaxID=174260 RepID=A0A9W9Z5Y7_9CNID|nr:hypothetical protein OS493_039206 [Desmophyllum pertusum]
MTESFDLLNKCLSLSAHPLRLDPRQLSVQLMGRLHKYIKKKELPFLKKVLEAAHNDDELLVALGDAGVRIWETGSGKLVHDISVKGINVEEEFGSLDASGELAVYCVHDQKTVHVLNVKTGKEVYKRGLANGRNPRRVERDKSKKRYTLPRGSSCLLVSKGTLKSQLKVYDATTDGKTVIAIRNNHELVKWDLNTGEATIVARLQPAFGVFGRRGDVVATAGSDGILRLYDARESVDEDETDVTAITKGCADSIWMLSAAADNRHVIASCTVKVMPEIAVWDALAGSKSVLSKQ